MGHCYEAVSLAISRVSLHHFPPPLRPQSPSGTLHCLMLHLAHGMGYGGFGQDRVARACGLVMRVRGDVRRPFSAPPRPRRC